MFRWDGTGGGGVQGCAQKFYPLEGNKLDKYLDNLDNDSSGCRKDGSSMICQS